MLLAALVSLLLRSWPLLGALGSESAVLQWFGGLGSGETRGFEAWELRNQWFYNGLEPPRTGGNMDLPVLWRRFWGSGRGIIGGGEASNLTAI